jgi:hypothetical protein
MDPDETIATAPAERGFPQNFVLSIDSDGRLTVNDHQFTAEQTLAIGDFMALCERLWAP